MISSAIDTITPIKNKKKLSNDNISSFKDTLNSLRAKKINVFLNYYLYYI